mmetsp:Transcript_19680/g.49629  ORF Transcript_19680/g.49629 Transcript_19680/m.49629 type:complete len:227 (-) Transcript_19680:2070-2750(-)
MMSSSGEVKLAASPLSSRRAASRSRGSAEPVAPGGRCGEGWPDGPREVEGESGRRSVKTLGLEAASSAPAAPWPSSGAAPSAPAGTTPPFGAWTSTPSLASRSRISASCSARLRSAAFRRASRSAASSAARLSSSSIAFFLARRWKESARAFCTASIRRRASSSRRRASSAARSRSSRRRAASLRAMVPRMSACTCTARSPIHSSRCRCSSCRIPCRRKTLVCPMA